MSEEKGGASVEGTLVICEKPASAAKMADALADTKP